MIKMDSNGISFVKHGAPHSNERPNKRTKNESCVDTLSLPPDTWAMVMEYLEISDLISVTSTCRFIRSEAASRVKALHVMKATELNSGVARRFRNARVVYIYSLVQCRYSDYESSSDDDSSVLSFAGYSTRQKYIVDFETCIRAASFLTQFNGLDKVVFGHVDGSKSYHYTEIPEPEYQYYVDASASTNMGRLIDSISSAFRMGLLSSNVSVKGIRCLNHYRRGYYAGGCSVCARACESFPIASVAVFDCQGSSWLQINSSRSHHLDICIGRKQLVRMLRAMTLSSVTFHCCSILMNSFLF
jgi:hypothetical protein